MSEPLKTGIVLYPLASGVTLQVTPLTVIGQQFIQEQSNLACPLPDPTPYETVIEDALIEGTKAPATDNPAYVELLKEAIIRRNFAFRMLVLEKCVQIAGKEGWQIPMMYYDQIANLGEDVYIWIKAQSGEMLKQPIESDILKLLYFFLAELKELDQIIDLCQRRLPITEGEIVEGFAYFRKLDV